MSRPQCPKKAKIEELPSDLKADVQILGVGHFQGKHAMIKISPNKKALCIVPDKYTRPVCGVWVSANQLKSYQMDVAHGLLYVSVGDNTFLDVARVLMRMVEVKDFMDSKTKLSVSALRMWLAEDVDLAAVEMALEIIGVARAEPRNFAKDMFLGLEVHARLKQGRSPSTEWVPLLKGHGDRLFQSVATLYESGIASDCKLISRDGKEFPAHRVILSAWSPVFTTMFSADMVEKATGMCRLENFDGNVVQALLSFLYKGVLPDIDQIVEDVLAIGEQYDIPDLRLACEETLARSVSMKNVVRYLHLAPSARIGLVEIHSGQIRGRTC